MAKLFGGQGKRYANRYANRYAYVQAAVTGATGLWHVNSGWRSVA